MLVAMTMMKPTASTTAVPTSTTTTASSTTTTTTTTTTTSPPTTTVAALTAGAPDGGEPAGTVYFNTYQFNQHNLLPCDDSLLVGCLKMIA